jgi:hypothetical protein
MAEIRLKSTGTIKLFENDNTSSVTIASPASLSGDRTITLPDANVTLASGTMLATDGDGSSLTALDATVLSGNLPAISGAAVTSLDAGNISAGTLATGRGGTGSTSTTFVSNTSIASTAITAQTVLSAAAADDRVLVSDTSDSGNLKYITQDNLVNLPAFITATGGTITTVDTDYKVHTFTGNGTFEVTCAGNASGSNSVDYLIIAGGGSGGKTASGGGGAGGYRINYPNPGTGGTPVTATTYPIVIGAGAAAQPVGQDRGATGGLSSGLSISSAGGGGGAGSSGTGAGGETATAGGSGGGGGGGTNTCTPGIRVGGAGNTPPVSPVQGYAGGTSASPAGPPRFAGSGGGGSSEVGTSGTAPAGAPGGNGRPSTINGSDVTRGGGGGGSQDCGATPEGVGGTGGGGDGGISPAGHPATRVATNGGDNTGGGGGGAAYANPVSGLGGSGVVIIRYKFQ